MKKILIAFVCSLGVGLAMTASPSQVCDDNNAVGEKNTTVVHAKVSKRNNESTRQLIKHEWKIKKVDFSKMNGLSSIVTHGVGALKVGKMIVHNGRTPLKELDPPQKHPIPPHKGIHEVQSDPHLWRYSDK